MVDQETLRGDGSGSPSLAGSSRTTTPSGQATGGAEGIMHRLVSLVELQIELFRIDLRAGAIRLLASFVLLILAGLLGIASCCVALLLIAVLLVDGGGFSQSGAFAITAAIGLFVTAGLALAALLCLAHAPGHSFGRKPNGAERSSGSRRR